MDENTSTTPVFDPTKKVTLDLDADELGFLANAMNFAVAIVIKADPRQASQYLNDLHIGIMQMGPLGYNTLNVTVEKLLRENFPGYFATDVLEEPTDPKYLPADYKAIMSTPDAAA